MAPPSRSETLQLIGYAGGLAAILAWFPWLGPLTYPFRLLITLVHELSHGLAALLTGGHFQRFVVFADGSGLAYTAGGWRLVVIPAGYLGAAAFGAALIFLGTRHRAARWALGALGLAVALLSLRYGIPSLLTGQALGGALAVTTGSALGAAFVAIALRASDRWVVFTVYLLAIQAGLAALTDLWTLIGLSGRGADTATDARSMAEIALLPPIVWAITWALAAAVLIAGAIRLAWRKEVRRPGVRAPRRSRA